MTKYYFDYYHYYSYENNTLKIITQKEYIEKTGESLYLINKLKNSYYPHQINDYFFLKPPFELKKHFLYYRLNETKYTNIKNFFRETLNIKVYYEKDNITIMMSINKENFKNIIKFFKDNFEKLVKVIESNNIISKEYEKYNDKILIIKTKTKFDRINILFNNKIKKLIYEKFNIPKENPINEIKNFKPNGYLNVDWKYKNIIKFFWSQGLVTTGIEQPDIKEFGFIGFTKESIKKLIELIGEDNLVFLESKSKPGLERRQENKNFDEKYPNDIRLVGNAINMSDKKLKWLHRKFKLEFPKHSEAHKGARMRVPGKKSWLKN